MIELLRRFGGKFRRYMVIGPACKLIEVIFDLLTPLVIAQMIDKGIGVHDVNAVVHYGMLLGAMAVIGISFTLVCQKMAALTSQGMGTDIRGALYQHINKLSYAELDRFGTPSLITRITNDVNQVQLAVALGVRMLIRWPFLAVGSMCAALAIDLKLGIIFLICTPAIGWCFGLSWRAAFRITGSCRQSSTASRLSAAKAFRALAWFAPLCAKITSVSALPKPPMIRPIPPSRWASSRRSSTP